MDLGFKGAHVRNRRQETGDWRLEAGGWRLGIGDVKS
jgi:hypothetical protein